MTVPPTHEGSFEICSSSALPKPTPPVQVRKTGELARALHLGEGQPMSAPTTPLARHHISIGGEDRYARISQQTSRLASHHEIAIREKGEARSTQVCESLSKPEEQAAFQILCHAAPSLLAKAELEHEFFHFDPSSNKMLWHTKKEINPENFLSAFQQAQPHISKPHYDQLSTQFHNPSFMSQMLPKDRAPSSSEPRLLVCSLPQDGQPAAPADIIPRERVLTLISLAQNTRNAMADDMVSMAESLGISLDLEEKKAEQQEKTDEPQLSSEEEFVAPSLSGPRHSSRPQEELEQENAPTGPSQVKIGGELAEKAEKEQAARIKRDDEFRKELKDTQAIFDRTKQKELEREKRLQPFKKPTGR